MSAGAKHDTPALDLGRRPVPLHPDYDLGPPDD